MADELVYVSWGGTGRGATLRAALERASREEKGLLYLAVLDDGHFADLDEAFTAVVRDELAWLLNAQLDLTKSQAGADDTPVRVLIRGGDVVDEVAEVVTAMGDTDVMIGAPIPLAGHESVDAMLDQLRGRVRATVTLVVAEEPAAGGQPSGQRPPAGRDRLADDDDDIAAAD